MKYVAAVFYVFLFMAAACAEQDPDDIMKNVPSLEELKERLPKAEARVKDLEDKFAHAKDEDEKKKLQASVNYERSALDELRSLIKHIPIREALVKRLDEETVLKIDAPLDEAVVKFKEATGIEITIGPYIQQKKPIRIDPKNMHLRDVLWSIAQQADAKWSVGMTNVNLIILKVPPDAWKIDLETHLSRRATLEFVDTPLADAVGSVRSLMSKSLILDPRIPADKSVNLRVKDMPLSEVLQWMARLSGAKMTLIDNAVYIHLDEPIPPAMKGELSGDDAKLLSRRVTFDFAETSVEEAIRFMNSVMKSNLIVDAEARLNAHPVTLAVQDMPMHLALTWICRLSNRTWEMKNGTIYFALAKPLPVAPAAAKPAAENQLGRLQVKTSDGTEINADATLLQQCPDLANSLLSLAADPVKDGLLTHAAKPDENVEDVKALLTKAAPNAQYAFDEKTRILLVTCPDTAELRRAAAALRVYQAQTIARKTTGAVAK